jgi:hypothetical protein
MDRKEFLRKSLQCGLGCCAFTSFETAPAQGATNASEELQQLQRQKEFTEHWLSDLVDTMERVLDEPTRIKLMAGCGQACHHRHKFTQDIVRAGKGNIDKLIEAYKSSFGIERKGDKVYIVYGPGPKGCWCPAAQDRPAKLNDLHCECTRGKHAYMWELALGRPFKVEILETIRRGGKQCRFVVHLA